MVIFVLTHGIYCETNFAIITHYFHINWNMKRRKGEKEMKKRKKVLAILLNLCMTLFLLTACTAESGGSTGSDSVAESTASKGNPTIRFSTNWSSGTTEFAQKWRSLVVDWGESNKETVTLAFEEEAGDNLRDKIKTDLTADNLPDIFQYTSKSSLKPMVDSGKLLNIDEYFAVSEKVSRDMFNEEDFLAYSFDGGETAYACPMEGSTNFMMYNVELFEEYGVEVPTTYEQLLEVSAVFNENGIIPVAVGSKGGNPSHFWYAAIFYQYYTQEEADAICGTLDSWANAEYVTRTGEIIEEMVAASVFPKDTIANGDFSAAVSLYNTEKAAMIYSFPWVISEFSDEVVAKSEMMNMIKMSDAIYDPSTFAVGGSNMGLVVTQEAFQDLAKQASIVDFMDNMLSDEAFQIAAEAGRWANKNMEYDNSTLSDLYIQAREFTKEQEVRVHLWNIMPTPASQEVFCSAMDELWSGAATTEQINEDIQKIINEQLDL